MYKTELKRTESGISTELCPPNLLILCDICDKKASQGIRTPNNAQCTTETVSQMGHNALLRQKKSVCYHDLLFCSVFEMTKESLSRTWLHTHIYDKFKSLIC